MRNPKTLDDFYNKLCDLHKRYVPHWRFSQFMINFVTKYGDTFYLEEDEFLRKIEEYLKARWENI